MIGAACDRIIASIYGEVPASSAVSVLDVGPDPQLPAPVQAGPGTADRPRPSIVTRYVQGVKTHWSTSMRFPNPLQAVVLAVGFGLCFLLGGTARLTSPTFDVIRNSGGAVVWGLAYIVVATALFGAWRIFRHGLVGA
jgi:hypothetical protein